MKNQKRTPGTRDSDFRFVSLQRLSHKKKNNQQNSEITTEITIIFILSHFRNFLHHIFIQCPFFAFL